MNRANVINKNIWNHHGHEKGMSQAFVVLSTRRIGEEADISILPVLNRQTRNSVRFGLFPVDGLLVKDCYSVKRLRPYTVADFYFSRLLS